MSGINKANSKATTSDTPFGGLGRGGGGFGEFGMFGEFGGFGGIKGFGVSRSSGR